ncbi:MAG: phosphate ABC transporter substrate-binding protein [Gammaproteobacteria bacterium]|nr:phosphate ABC transporter substrate-binding protein [Gammaproteobacteria bacterium]
MKKSIVSIFILFPLMFLGSVNSYAGLVVVVHPSNSLQAISKENLKRIYLSKKKKFSDGSLISPLDHPKDSETKKIFYKEVVGKSLSQVSSYWSRLIFSGKGIPPRVMRGDEEIKVWVASHSEGIGYINENNTDNSVKVILNIK